MLDEAMTFKSPEEKKTKVIANESLATPNAEKELVRTKLNFEGDTLSKMAAYASNADVVNAGPIAGNQLEKRSNVQTPAENYGQLAVSQTSKLTEQSSDVDENLNETSCDNEMTFLNNLDLEKLVLVQATRGGTEVFEIHEINPTSQEISEVPLDLPARYFDLIISVMTSQDEEE